MAAHAPVFNVLGSFFPAWLACLAAGIVLAFVVHIVVARLGVESEMKPLVLVYPCIVATFAFVSWLIFFA